MPMTVRHDHAGVDREDLGGPTTLHKSRKRPSSPRLTVGKAGDLHRVEIDVGRIRVGREVRPTLAIVY